MRKFVWLVGILLLLCQSVGAQSSKEPLGDVARRVRAARAKKNLSKIPYYTNSNIPHSGAVSSLGQQKSTPSGTAQAGQTSQRSVASGKGQADEEDCDEQCWRSKFAEQRNNIKQAERELDILQREYNLARTQYYQDPNRAMQEQYSNNPAGGRELQDLQNQINAKKKDVQDLQKGLRDLQTELRRAGKPPGWAREK